MVEINKIDFSENRNAYMPSKEILKAYKETIEEIYKYPDYKNVDVNNSIANFFGISAENVSITNGSMEGINLLTRVLNRKKSTLFLPTFWGYEDALTRYNYIVKKNNLIGNLDYDIIQIEKQAKSADLIFLCNPNNPTLSLIEKQNLLSIIKNNPECNFIIDETMLLFSTDFDNLTVSKEITNYSNLSVILSFSKLFGIAGLRTGALISNEDIINKMKKEMVPYGIGSIAQNVIPVALENTEYLNETRKKIAVNRQNLCESFEQLGDYKIIEGVTNFILVKLPDEFNATKLTEYLMKNNMIVRNINEAYPLLSGEWIRVSINTETNNKKLIKKIELYQDLSKRQK